MTVGSIPKGDEGRVASSDGISVVSFQIDNFSLREFEEAVRSAGWLEEIHADNKRSERIRRAMRVVRIILRASPAAVSRNVSEAARELGEAVETVDVETLRRRLDALEFMLLLLAALREMERGRHGGEIEESFAMTLQTLGAALNESNVQQLRKEVVKALNGVEAVLTTSRR